MATYLVTGVAGFIAARVAELLLAEGHRVVGLDSLNDAYDVRLKDHRLARLLGRNGPLAGASGKSTQGGCAPPLVNAAGTFEFHPVDIENATALDTLFAACGFDAVFHLAARAGVRASIEIPRVYLATNALGALNVLECLRAHRVKKLVLASTSSLYAGGPMPFREDQPVNTPLSPYAATKKAAEMLAYSYHRLHGIDTTVLRYFTVFGPAGRPDMSPFRFIKWIDEGRPIQLFGDGTQARDFTFVDDIARGTILAAKPLGYEVINLGGGRNPITLHAMIRIIERELGKKAVLEMGPFSAADMKETWADIAKAGVMLGWKPEIGVEEGFHRTVAWHRENRDWLHHVNV